MYIVIINNFLILSIENWFGNDEVIFQDGNAFCLKTNGIKAFLPEKKHIKSMVWPGKI